MVYESKKQGLCEGSTLNSGLDAAKHLQQPNPSAV